MGRGTHLDCKVTLNGGVEVCGEAVSQELVSGTMRDMKLHFLCVV
jgi:hypothetical protein